MPQKTSQAKPKHIPLRRCVACRDSKPQAELIRFYKLESGAWQLDEAYAANNKKTTGRGAWLCQNEACHSQKALGRFFRADAKNISENLSKYKKNSSASTIAKRVRVETGGMNA